MFINVFVNFFVNFNDLFYKIYLMRKYYYIIRIFFIILVKFKIYKCVEGI